MLDKFLDLVWPRRCTACGGLVDRPRGYFCSDCLNRLPFIPTDGCCRRCGRDAEKLDGEYLCTDCRARRPAFDRAASALRFEGVAREAVNAFKFRRAFNLRNDLVDFLEGTARARFHVEEIGLVVPMPSTLLHRLDRGYNQCSVLARGLAKRLGKSCRTGLVWRKGNPKRQGELDEEARRTNVVGTFAVLSPSVVADKTVLVVDDIMTTGSTLSECAAELKRSGASRVWCLTLARSLRS